ncbi:MAG: alpha/beta fold hydrolase [Firmicutes bacterium]|nr:alpha/beta fold hydrolase [Alicyclobacillaceae bacterium]MCL6497458.1 alpha/beta fold hydrolase [Bacillota bacterium]
MRHQAPWISAEGATYRVSWYESGAGPAMVWLHGGGGTGKDFWYQLKAFGTRWRVLAPDLPGFGRSDWPPEIRGVQDLPDFLARWLATLGVKAAVVGGNSMGGRVALAYAARYPDRVTHLILIDSVGLDLPGVPVQNPLAVPPQRFLETLVHRPTQYLQHTPYRTVEDAQELSRGRQSFARYLAASPIVQEPGLLWEQVAMPTLVVWGREDRIVPLAYGEALAARLPRARLVVFDACGHLPHLEWPERFNQTVAAFLAEA